MSASSNQRKPSQPRAQDHSHAERKLSVIHGGAGSESKTKLANDNALRIIFAFVGLVGLVLTILLIFVSNAPADFTVPQRQFNDLHTVYEREGIEGFKRTKSELRSKVKDALDGDPDDPTTHAATNIALYLFPDVLGGDNLEKTEGTSLWGPMQEAIEKNPRGPDARIYFEEMRANIWNYENPDRNNPNLSQTAKQVIKIYEGMSVP